MLDLCKTTVVYTTGIGCADPAGLKSADAWLVYDNEGREPQVQVLFGRGRSVRGAITFHVGGTGLQCGVLFGRQPFVFSYRGFIGTFHDAGCLGFTAANQCR